eukprot:CAMPEP_0174386932 /NCGR_PEP_ID=MMETSP0811_2-20130205/127620_1 /TAXON_ID=73025 ORGANISM="Eutreptiella gymnastica-like, Strain CCMP1594" /NCGR_SAMPLE_ID=MMETSP0811_2 /ASSEMBLY_ACC=CAM_ASM_000667 /LENGTH=121 /DNA_ID=CAMNT_0015541791 /DNA_START=93 /DNA_END=458 /DNA_ORIENTATION=-
MAKPWAVLVCHCRGASDTPPPNARQIGTPPSGPRMYSENSKARFQRAPVWAKVDSGRGHPGSRFHAPTAQAAGTAFTPLRVVHGHIPPHAWSTVHAQAWSQACTMRQHVYLSLWAHVHACV